MSWPIIIILGVLTALWLRWRHYHKRMLEMAKKFPGPPPLPLLGNALHFMGPSEDYLRTFGKGASIRHPPKVPRKPATEMINIIKELRNRYGDVIRFWLGPDLNILVSDPDDIKILLTSQKTSYKGPQYKYMADFLGLGILSGSGPSWRKHRKIASPNYGRRAVESYTDIFNSEVGLLLEKLNKDPMGRSVNVYKDVVMCTTYIVCQTLMGLTREQTLSLPHLEEVVEKSVKLYDVVFLRMTKWYLQIDPVYWFTSHYQNEKIFKRIMNSFCSTIINHRKDKIASLKGKVELDTEKDELSNTELSVIDRFCLSEELNDYEMITETFTIFTSSQEATAKMASFLLLMMAYHPKCQEKLYAEIQSVIGTEDRPVSDEEFKRMPYLDMVFKEILRLYPIGVMLQRTLKEDITISSGTLPAGCSLVVPIFHMHRDPRYWTDPEAFNPERFSPENTRLRQPNCYIPFSLGPMDCLGRYFGTKLVKTLCVRVLRQFELSSNESYKDLKLCMAISTLSLNGYHVIFNRRK